MSSDPPARDDAEAHAASTSSDPPASVPSEQAAIHAVDVGRPPVFAGPVLRRTGAKPRRTIVVSGAKGGAGKSVTACNLAIYLSTLGRTTLLVDADRSGAHLHTLLGVAPDLPSQRGSTSAPRQPTIVQTPVPSLYFVHGSVDEGRGDDAATPSRQVLFAQLASVDCDYLVIDLGAGIDTDLLDVYLAADIALYVILPEPPAVEGTYRFVRALFLRSLVTATRSWGERESLLALAAQLGGLPVPRELVEALEADAHPLAAPARALLASQALYFVVNQSRVRTDLELGESLRSAAWQRFEVGFHYLGYIDHDDNVWACVRERRPLLVKSPGTKASKSFEKLARRLLALDSRNPPQPVPRSAPRGSHHDLLEIERGATDEEIRRAYRRMRDVYAEEALCCYGLYTSEELMAVRARLDEAFDVLLDPARRRPYELTVFPDAEAAFPEEAPLESGARDLPPAPAISPETEFDGSLLRLVRESQGLELKQISRRTKINLAYLEAVEGDDFSALPALVYVRGFVAEMAKCLRLDPVQVAHTYVRRVRQQHGAGETA